MAQRDDRLRTGAHLAIDIADARLGAQRAEHRGFVARPILLNIEPGAKAAPRAAQDDDAHLGAIGESAEIGVEVVDQSFVQRIQPIGPVERRDLDLPARLDQQLAHSV